jgi:GTP cyclohydrolase I
VVVNLRMQTAVSMLLSELGYDLDDPHFQRTPERVAEAMTGFGKARFDRAADILDVTFEDGFSSLVLVGPIAYTSMCAHHLLPVQGKAYVGYLADGRICGLSKLARLTDHYARQLTVQERVTDQIADALEEHLKPKGCMVVIRAVHGCMAIRGVQDGDAQTTTSAVRGLHKESDSARSEFLALVAMRERGLQ